MSDFCDFVPDDPSCVEPEPPVEDGDKIEVVVEVDDGMVITDEMRSKMLQANITYLVTAMFVAVDAALQTFRYRSDSTYYDAGDAVSPNYWKLLNQAWGYWAIAFMGIASITQLLSMLGIAAEINVMVWMYGGMIDMVISLVSTLVGFYAYDAYWTVKEDSSSA